MASYFLDTSAIVKRYVPEQGQSLITTLCDPSQDHQLYISQAALVEVVAAICRRVHDRSITVSDRDRLIDAFRSDSQKAYSIQVVTTTIYTSAGNLCRSHRLRAYDAVQLACALRLRDKALLRQGPAPIFVCADNNLTTIATVEGLSVENPNNYP
ncbi:MAG: type II toxin-antitoxin system VapC family toxin [Chloroflexi bacterium]|nr:type II toxin-antitoxin system VapC family toxin [Chloroflexota bacterium]